MARSRESHTGPVSGPLSGTSSGYPSAGHPPGAGLPEDEERDTTHAGPPVIVEAPRRRWPAALAAVSLLAAVLLAAKLFGMLPSWLDPFGDRTVDRSQPVLLQAVRDLSRYEGASGEFQVVVDLEKDAKFLPDVVRGERTLFVGAGSVDAFVDFSGLSGEAISISPDRRSVTIRLPNAQLEPTNLDTRRSYVYAQQRGLLDRFGSFFSSNPSSQQQLYVLAADKITAAAQQAGLRERAEKNTQAMLEQMLGSLGFENVTVTFPPPS